MAGVDYEHIYFYHSSQFPAERGFRPSMLYLHQTSTQVCSVCEDNGIPSHVCAGCRSSSRREVEFMSRISGLTNQHGHWELTEQDNKLTIHFNCREGQSDEHQCLQVGLRLHPTRLIRLAVDMGLQLEPGSFTPMTCIAGKPVNASWEGTDDKGYVIHLVHFRSYLKNKTFREIGPLWSLAKIVWLIVSFFSLLFFRSSGRYNFDLLQPFWRWRHGIVTESHHF